MAGYRSAHGKRLTELSLFVTSRDNVLQPELHVLSLCLRLRKLNLSFYGTKRTKVSMDLSCCSSLEVLHFDGFVGLFDLEPLLLPGSLRQLQTYQLSKDTAEQVRQALLSGKLPNLRTVYTGTELLAPTAAFVHVLRAFEWAEPVELTEASFVKAVDTALGDTSMRQEQKGLPCEELTVGLARKGVGISMLQPGSFPALRRLALFFRATEACEMLSVFIAAAGTSLERLCLVPRFLGDEKTAEQLLEAVLQAGPGLPRLSSLTLVLTAHKSATRQLEELLCGFCERLGTGSGSSSSSSSSSSSPFPSLRELSISAPLSVARALQKRFNERLEAAGINSFFAPIQEFDLA